MAKELEVKVLNIDKDEIEEKLKAIGARLIKKEYQINTIFDSDNRKIKKEHNGYLRLRETRDLINIKTEFMFTLKKNIENNHNLRENVEIETLVEDKDALFQILDHLDLKIEHQGTKERTSYIYDKIRFDIDTWDKETYPNPYLEIEVQHKEDLDKAIALLELDENNVTTKSIGQLRMELGLSDI